MAHTEKSQTSKPFRTLSLVRVEAAYGPIYLVVVSETEDKAGDDYAQLLPTRSEWDRLNIEEWRTPEEVFHHVVAVLKGGEAQPERLFTHVRSYVADPDFQDYEIMDTADWLKIFPEAAK